MLRYCEFATIIKFCITITALCNIFNFRVFLINQTQIHYLLQLIIIKEITRNQLFYYTQQHQNQQHQSIKHFKHMDKFLINSQTMSQPVKIDKIQGLILVNDFINKEDQKQLITHINQSQWNLSLKRRTQHYGYEYRYDRKNQISQTQPLPQWSFQIKHKIQQYLNQHTELFSLKKQQEEDPHKSMTFDQLIINEYQPGQGINPHIDNVKLFDEPIVSLSLGSECVMEFDREISNEKGQHQDETVEVLLKRRSLAVLTGDARYKWKHSIPARKKDNGKPRTIRCSMTWRIMNNQILNSDHKQIQTKPTNQTDL